MATTKARAALVSSDKLSSAIDAAVKLAAERHQLAVSDKNVITNWELIGRVLRDAALAHKFSTDVAAQVTKSAGVSVQPATYQIGKQILCGFIEKGRLPITRDLF